VLADIAGFQQFRRSDSRSANPSAQGATLRALGGNASSRTLIILDGVPMADPFFGYIPFSALVPDRLSAVRVTRGGGAGAFGAGAVAGTIEMVSATRKDLPTYLGSAFIGSRNSTELSASLSPNLGNGFVSLSGRWDRGDGFQTTPDNQCASAPACLRATVPAAYDGWSVGLRAVAPLAPDMEVQVRGLVFHDARTLRFAGADNSSQGQDASVRIVARGPWKVDALAYVQARNFSNVVISSSTYKVALDQRNTPSTGIGGKIELRPPVGTNHVVRVGIDTRLANGDMFEEKTGGMTERRHAGGDQSITGLFVEDDWTLGSLVLTGSARADHWTISDGFYQTDSATGVPTAKNSFPNRSDWAFSGRVGAVLHLSDAIAVRAAGYTGLRLPTLNELYRPFTVFPITTQANAALAPEKLKGAEVGIDLTPADGVMIGMTAFYNRLDDAIANVTTGKNQRQRRNIDAVIAKGIELTANAKLPAGFALSTSYAYSHSIARAPGQAFNGFAPAQSPRHAASATLGWTSPQGASLSATLRYVGKQYEDDLQTDALPDVLTLDAVARFPLREGVMLKARGENLLDTTVITRNVAGSMDLGAPRTIWVGIGFAF
jgi:iron complex outermembrane receptor protein